MCDGISRPTHQYRNIGVLTLHLRSDSSRFSCAVVKIWSNTGRRIGSIVFIRDECECLQQYSYYILCSPVPVCSRNVNYRYYTIISSHSEASLLFDVVTAVDFHPDHASLIMPSSSRRSFSGRAKNSGRAMKESLLCWRRLYYEAP